MAEKQQQQKKKPNKMSQTNAPKCFVWIQWLGVGICPSLIQKRSNKNKIRRTKKLVGNQAYYYIKHIITLHKSLFWLFVLKTFN